jgi:alkanesulfonate monooxygenase SsuD/methylene tetrahydromethanopterin reductase-like flavin-dependent oxidoreductase (luciferase family)
MDDRRNAMKYGLLAPNFGDYADARVLSGLAREAEAAGWDGFFIWDHIATPVSPLTPDWGAEPLIDPWVALTAIALATERVRIGPMVTPVSRRRPWKLARESVSVDQLSGGRLTLGVGSGFPGIVAEEFAAFGEPVDAKERAALLDEGLDILRGLWRGQPFSYRGQHYQLDNVQFLPPPVQMPRVPVWVPGFWPNRAPFRRAARWDGLWPVDLTGPLTPATLRTMLAYVAEHRTESGPFDVVVADVTPGDDAQRATELVAPFAEAGATWWVEYLGPFRGPLEAMRERIAQGPPPMAREPVPALLTASAAPRAGAGP